MATLKEIADRLNISVSTVSRALNGSNSISREMQARIRDVAEELGYTLKGRGGKYSPEWNIAGLIVAEVCSEYYAKIVHLAQERFAQRGYSTVIQITNFGHENLHSAIKIMRCIGVRCLLIVMDDEEKISQDIMDAIHKSGLPVMLVTSKYFTMIDVDCIHTNETSGILMGVQHLLSRNYRKIGFIGERMTENRHTIFKQVMEEHVPGWRPQFIAVGRERGALGGYLRMKELLGMEERPDAVFASYDLMAIGAIHAIREAGLKIPGDIAVLGFDNITESEYVEGGITTIASPSEDMIAIAINILMKRIQSSAGALQQVALQPKLIVRETT
ncbi:MAG TPA: LacI family DNA-binding transcriptional regulator [Feifaniaceae bacterium]|nr:LacI family DNA-binding transcriptional regulator [Feifaniaceae bacterium]